MVKEAHTAGVFLKRIGVRTLSERLLEALGMRLGIFAIVFTLCPLCVSAVDIKGSEPLFKETLTPGIGLWPQPGRPSGHSQAFAHLEQVHPLRLSAGRLVVAAQLGRLRELPVTEVLNAFRRYQCLDNSPAHGNLSWYAEEKGVVNDTNAAFFVGLNLCVLRLEYSEQLTKEQCKQLDEIAVDLKRWFDGAVLERSFHYPNKYLGDLVTSWLLHEWLKAEPSPGLLLAIEDASNYWLKEGWGWGEHLSETYSGVMLNELGVLLSLSKNLPPTARTRFVTLMDALLKKEETYSGGPWVPSIRCYAFSKRPEPKSWLKSIREWDPKTISEREKGGSFSFGHLFHAHGIQGRARATTDAKNVACALSIPCYNGAIANAWISAEARIGSMTRFPIMPEAEYQTWGLAWQSFPVAFADNSEGWGFLRWRTREAGEEYAHPAVVWPKLKSLSKTVQPPPLGYTEARQSGPRVIVLRRMPQRVLAWEELSDVIELLGFHPEEIRVEKLPTGGDQIKFKAGGKLWLLGHHPLASGVQSIWNADSKGAQFTAAWPHAALQNPSLKLAHLWWISIGEAPAVQVECLPQAGPYLNEQRDSIWRVSWQHPDGERPWVLELDLRRAPGEGFIKE